MLDRKYIVENADLIIRNCTNRGVTCDVPKLVELETARPGRTERPPAMANTTSIERYTALAKPCKATALTWTITRRTTSDS